jgi:hypothetical protein
VPGSLRSTLRTASHHLAPGMITSLTAMPTSRPQPTSAAKGVCSASRYFQ